MEKLTRPTFSPEFILEALQFVVMRISGAFGHCAVEVCHSIIDWIYDEDRPTIRTGHVPENMTRLRRFATGLLKSK